MFPTSLQTAVKILFFLCTANLENNLFISTKEYHTIYQRFSSQLLAQIISSAAECDMAEYESPSVLREPVVMKWNIVRILKKEDDLNAGEPIVHNLRVLITTLHGI